MVPDKAELSPLAGCNINKNIDQPDPDDDPNLPARSAKGDDLIPTGSEDISVDGDNPGSISRLIELVKQEDCDSAAAIALWKRYFAQLRDIARKRFGNSQALDADEEDAALAAFHALLEGFSKGRFDKVSNRDELWRLLVTITKRKVAKIKERNHRLKRGGGFKKSSTPPSELATAENPEDIVELSDTIRSVVESLPSERYRKVFYLRTAGHSIAEIAEIMDQNERTIQRQLDMIRILWKKQD